MLEKLAFAILLSLGALRVVGAFLPAPNAAVRSWTAKREPGALRMISGENRPKKFDPLRQEKPHNDGMKGEHIAAATVAAVGLAAAAAGVGGGVATALAVEDLLEHTEYDSHVLEQVANAVTHPSKPRHESQRNDAVAAATFAAVGLAAAAAGVGGGSAAVLAAEDLLEHSYYSSQVLEQEVYAVTHPGSASGSAKSKKAAVAARKSPQTDGFDPMHVAGGEGEVAVEGFAVAAAALAAVGVATAATGVGGGSTAALLAEDIIDHTEFDGHVLEQIAHALTHPSKQQQQQRRQEPAGEERTAA